MRIIATVSLLLSLSSYSLLSQDYELIPYRLKDKWGFVDSTMKIMIKPKYDNAIPFMFGHAAFKKNGKWGLINLKDEVIMSPRFDSVGTSFWKYFGEDIILDVYINNQWQSCDTNGNIVKVDELELEMTEGDYVNRDPQIYQENGLYGIKDYQSNILIAPTNQMIIKPSEYSTIYYFMKNHKWGRMNHAMEVTIENKYDSLIWDLGSSMTIAVLGDKMGLLNYKGQTVLPLDYKLIKDAKYGGFYIVNQEGKMGFANENGKVLIEPKHQKIIKHFEELAYSYFENGSWGYFDRENDITIDAKYRRIKAFEHGYAEVQTIEGKKGYIDTEGVEFFKK